MILHSVACLCQARKAVVPLLAAVIGVLTIFPAVANSSDTLLLAPSDSGIYAEFHSAFKSSLSLRCKLNKNRGLAACQDSSQSVRLTTKVESDASPGSLVISLGTKSGEQLAKSRREGPRFFTLIPAAGFKRLESCCLDSKSSTVGGLFVDQPLQRQFALTRQLLPEKNRIGVLLGKENRSKKAGLEKEARKQGFTITVKIVDSSSAVGPALKSLVGEIDVLLAVPDHLVYNSKTIVNLLLSSYRHKIPVIGYSKALVNAGATAAIYTEVEQLADVAAGNVLNYYRTHKLGSSHYAEKFTVKVNRDVARSLGLRPASDKKLKQSIEGALR
ncbi:ABC transporter substrate-binding protein [Solemya velum gill symbiont]|uniref:ABC transporter substrate-binding protein n=1 Tax=Solemya velum gill symbiont TaxID=2340 RepID=UPI0009D508A4|nr:ABC transporter substrate binding protein [Solemya velum gill symbiont]OOZ50837.1 hypothetical protein BOW39_01415 [Solemya velum gill symbiont]OOZ57113.1 hypothetical protein BOW42_04310 [Solemya velum gill symbiont]OOZ63003.1 hypothetical protein BOW44_00545 [Solemya velum gill symbiont]OOZ65544.1 hypothetical protein BOW45_01780 [Solemya velum gill symbiont]OOZ68144.1 hypothetical protein BOW46_00475 [Solemya velum gill symbiont]